jgi:DNA-binding response OmpR family regulator
MSEPRAPGIVVIDDAPEVRLLLDEVLGAEGFRVRTAEDWQRGLALVKEEEPDVVLLDLVLPGMDGFEICRQLRQRSAAYVIVLSSKGEQIDRVRGLSAGADDYLAKPFSTAELVARIRAMLRRPRTACSNGHRRRVRDLELDLDAREVRLAGEPVNLTPIEFALLDALMAAPRRVHSREELLTRVWGPDRSSSINLVDVHISKLRRKLGDDSRYPTYVRTVRSEGYRMCDDVSCPKRPRLHPDVGQRPSPTPGVPRGQLESA